MRRNALSYLSESPSPEWSDWILQGPSNQSYSCRFFSLSRSSINYAHSFFPFNLSPNISLLLSVLTIFFMLLPSPSFPPLFHSIHPSRFSLSSTISVAHPSSMSPSLMYPLSISFSSPSKPSIPVLPPLVLSLILPASPLFPLPVKWIAIGFSQSLHRRAQRGKNVSSKRLWGRSITAIKTNKGEHWITHTHIITHTHTLVH